MAEASKRGTLVAGNWKMYKSLDLARELAQDILAGLPAASPDRPTVGLFPNAIALERVAESVDGREAQVLVGAQNMHCELEGAFTGEISPEMITSAGGRGVLLGHSERRHVFGEDDALIGRKVRLAVSAGLTTILCVGETIEQREAGQTEAVVGEQLVQGLAGLTSDDEILSIIVAYEPVWAIGTGKTATPGQGQEVHRYLRGQLSERLEAAAGAEQVQILYGGSVKPENAGELISEPDIDGFLVGGASLKADSFLKICAAVA